MNSNQIPHLKFTSHDWEISIPWTAIQRFEILRHPEPRQSQVTLYVIGRDRHYAFSGFDAVDIIKQHDAVANGSQS